MMDGLGRANIDPYVVAAMQIQLEQLQQQNKALHDSMTTIQQQQQELSHGENHQEETKELDLNLC